MQDMLQTVSPSRQDTRREEGQLVIERRDLFLSSLLALFV